MIECSMTMDEIKALTRSQFSGLLRILAERAEALDPKAAKKKSKAPAKEIKVTDAASAASALEKLRKQGF